VAGLVETSQSLGNGIEGQAILGMFIFLPTGAQPQDSTALANVIEGGGHFGEHRRVAVGVAAHQSAHFQPRHAGRQG